MNEPSEHTSGPPELELPDGGGTHCWHCLRPPPLAGPSTKGQARRHTGRQRLLARWCRHLDMCARCACDGTPHASALLVVRAAPISGVPMRLARVAASLLRCVRGVCRADAAVCGRRGSSRMTVCAARAMLRVVRWVSEEPTARRCPRADAPANPTPRTMVARMPTPSPQLLGNSKAATNLSLACGR